MAGDRATMQADNRTPAIRGKVLVIAVDSTSRAYDLSAVSLIEAGHESRREALYLDMYAQGADIYYSFKATTSSHTVDDTATVAAAGSPVITDSMCDVIPNGTREQVRVDRSKYASLAIKTASGTGTLRIRASSQGT